MPCRPAPRAFIPGTQAATQKYHTVYAATPRSFLSTEVITQSFQRAIEPLFTEERKDGWQSMTELPEGLHITYQLQYRKCGKQSCGTCKQGPGHGPYWYAYWREGSRLRSGYIGKTQPVGLPATALARAEARLATVRVGA